MTKLGNDEIDTDVYEILDQNASTSMQTQINDLKEMRGVAKTCMNAQQVYRSFKIIQIGIRTWFSKCDEYSRCAKRFIATIATQ